MSTLIFGVSIDCKTVFFSAGSLAKAQTTESVGSVDTRAQSASLTRPQSVFFTVSPQSYCPLSPVPLSIFRLFSSLVPVRLRQPSARNKSSTLQTQLADIKIRAARFWSFCSFSERPMPRLPETTSLYMHSLIY